MSKALMDYETLDVDQIDDIMAGGEPEHQNLMRIQNQSIQMKGIRLEILLSRVNFC